MKLSNLLERDFKIVEKRKILYLVPVAIVVLAIIMGIIFRFTLGSAVNLGMDFTGGYTVNVELSTKLTDENYGTYVSQIEDIFENLSNEDGEKYGLKVSSVQKQGSGETASIYVRYKSVKEEKGVDTQSLMENEINVRLIEQLNTLFKITPSNVTYEDGKVTATYLEVISDPILEDIRAHIAEFSEKNSLNISKEDVVRSADNSAVVVINAQIAEENRG